jgi:phage gp36-like protein
MSELKATKGTEARFSFMVRDAVGAAFDLTGATVTFSATNETQTLSKTATVTAPTTGAALVVLAAADTSSWTAPILPLSWTLRVAPLTGGPFDVDAGWLLVAALTPRRLGYCAPDDLASSIPDQRLAELTAETGSLADSTVLTKAIADVADLIDGSLGGRYAIPVTDAVTLALLRPIAIPILKFMLFGRRDLDSKDDPTRVQYDNAMRWLRDVQKGDANLPGSATPASVPDAAVGSVVWVSDDPVFGGSPL